jgi:predicted ester cyclase
VVTRMTWSGTHEGELRRIAATGKRVSYEGAGFFTVAAGLITEAWIVGDTHKLWRALGTNRTLG